MNAKKTKIFSDFDGTITIYDTWIEMGDCFIEDKQSWSDIIKDFENQKIGARDCFLKECSLVRNFDIQKFNDIIDKQRIDPKFKDFYRFCCNNMIELTILSEGMDYYIDRILKNNNINLPFYSNKFVLHEGGKSFHLEFPWSDSDCTRCGTSKRNLLMNMTSDDEVSVFIGDGFSDACVVNYADIVFAKKSLASYCWKNNITYFDWNDFGDVQKKLEKITAQKKIKHRQDARLKRRDVFLRG